MQVTPKYFSKDRSNLLPDYLPSIPPNQLQKCRISLCNAFCDIVGAYSIVSVLLGGHVPARHDVALCERRPETIKKATIFFKFFVLFCDFLPGVEVVMSKVASLPVCRSKSLGNSATTVKLSVEL